MYKLTKLPHHFSFKLLVQDINDKTSLEILCAYSNVTLYLHQYNAFLYINFSVSFCFSFAFYDVALAYSSDYFVYIILRLMLV